MSCSGIQEAPVPPAGPLNRDAEPVAETDEAAQPPAHSTHRQASAEDAVDRAAAAQLRLDAQSDSQGEQSQNPAALTAAASGGVDAAVAKQSKISAKLAGAYMPAMDQGAAAAADAVVTPESARGNDAAAAPASGPGPTPAADSRTTPCSAGAD